MRSQVDACPRVKPAHAPLATSFPATLRLVCDRTARVSRDLRTLTGGDPPRALRLSPAGREAVARFAIIGPGDGLGGRALARRLTDAGLLHPAPEPVDVPENLVTIVIPVRDRQQQLERCLRAIRRDRFPGRVIVADDGSSDPLGIARLCQKFGAEVLRLSTPSGPAAARNAGAAQVDTPLIAFLDSDCLPPPGWLGKLAGHFQDPLVAAVAPRIVGVASGRAGAVARFAAAQSPLGMGPHPSRVVPGGRVSYVPSAALLTRREALGDGFDSTLRYGEDVDLVWRLHEAGWRVRYDPAVVVRHAEPDTWQALLTRRFRYGTSAAPLATRHPGRVSPLVLSPWSCALAAATLAKRPYLAAAILAVQSATLHRRLRCIDVPVAQTVRWPLTGAALTLLACGRAATTLTPWALIAGLRLRRIRYTAVVLLTVTPVVEWGRLRPPLDPIRWTLLHLADRTAYGAGVWVGSIHLRTTSALRPRFTAVAGRSVELM